MIKDDVIVIMMMIMMMMERLCMCASPLPSKVHNFPQFFFFNSSKFFFFGSLVFSSWAIQQ